MRNYAGLAALLAISLFGQNLSPPPWVRQGGVFNAASHLTSAIPGGSLAPGALIAIEGLRFVPGDIAVEIEAGGRVYSASVVTSTTERIVAKLPAKINASGAAKLFVRSRGKRSTGSDIRLAASAFGIYTVNGKGWGLAASVDDPLAPPEEPGVIAVPGRVTLSGTGLGRAAESAIEVYVADRKAEHVRRSERNGTEHLSFDLPAGTPPGCAVPVVVAIGGVTSNTAVLRTAGGHGCGSNSIWYRDDRAPGRSSAVVVLLRSDVVLELDPGKPVPFNLDNLSATFERRMAGPVEESPLDFIPPPGACMSYAGSIDPNSLVPPILTGPSPDNPDLDLGPDIADKASSLEDLDAGPELTISGPEGIRRAVRSTHKPRVYSAILGGNPPVTRIPPTPLFLAPGVYRLEIPGGPDVGKASVTVNVPNPIMWRNRDATSALDRKLGAQLEWTLPEGYTAVVFAWNINRRTASGGLAVCVPVARTTKFRIPPSALANLPATIVSDSDLSLGFLGVAAVPIEPAGVPARGVDYSRLTAASLSGPKRGGEVTLGSVRK